ncbi:MAG: DUF1501 domain-containing protein [Planctomycetaceae bacterium]|nr:DUF1501 domain-containing protein [Planctomycetaceae bacterium]
MLTILGRRYGGYCDGLTRRGFLRVGALGAGVGALSLADLYRIEANQSGASGNSSTGRQKSVINIFLGGGPPHQDMWEIKTDAPKEIRGEFSPIDTAVPGIQIGEVFPQIAALMDKVAIIRSVVGATDRHDGFQCMTGWLPTELQSIGGRPSLGAVVSKLQGPTDPAVPPFVGLAEKTKEIRWSDSGKPGFLGAAFSPFKPDGQGMSDMKLTDLSIDRLRDRRDLLVSVDKLRREVDASGMMRGMDEFGRRALDVLTSSKLLDALDLSKEDPKIVERYGSGKPYKYQYDGAPTVNEHLLVARRLIEAGVRVVTLSFGRWDSHGKNFDLVRDHGGKLDQCLSALIEDLNTRGMLDDVTTIVWGEFGRTPRVNKDAGRDHWPAVSCALLAGGGMRTGQAIGSTNRLGEFAQTRPVHFQEIFATLYRNLGINPETTTLVDPSGRPQYLTQMAPIRELV